MLVVAGLVPAIHVLLSTLDERRGSPGMTTSALPGLRILHFAAMCLARSVADFGTIITEKAR
jgi:hypothetical protein